MTTATAPTPNALPPRLFEVLEEQSTISQEMLALLTQEQAALVAVDVQGIVALARRKTNLLQRLQAADTLIQEMTGQLLADDAAAPASLTSLINQLPANAERDRLAELRQRLLGLREEILAKNTINTHFAEDAGSYLRDAISLITHSLAEHHDSYSNGGNPGKRPPSANRPALISKEV